MISGRCGVIKHNCFNKDLEWSLTNSDDKMFNEFYLRAFPLADNIETVDYDTKENKALQHMGIDKIIHFPNGNTVTVDEKKRRKDYGDILLELWSNKEQRKLGWLFYSQCDYIVYAVMPSKKIYLLPVLLLQMAWKSNGANWIKEYPKYLANNKYYNTENIAIPTNVLLTAIGNEMEQNQTA